MQLYWDVLFWSTRNGSVVWAVVSCRSENIVLCMGDRSSLMIPLILSCDYVCATYCTSGSSITGAGSVSVLNLLLPLLRDLSVFVSTPCFFLCYGMILKVFYWDALKSIFWWVAHPGGSITGSVDMSTRDTWSVWGAVTPLPWLSGCVIFTLDTPLFLPDADPHCRDVQGLCRCCPG